MKKAGIILITVILLAAFGLLVYQGLRHARGVPVAKEKIERVVLEVPFIDKEPDLAKGISSDIWEPLSSKEIKLVYQLMVLPWPKGVTSPISIKAFHNKEDIYFYIKWKDDTEDADLGINKFSDACAVMFPLGDKVQPSTIMMGFIGKANIWQWKASQDKEYWQGILRKTDAYSDFYYPFEEDELFVVSKDEPRYSANDLLAIRVGTITKKEVHNVHARGFWKDGVWQVVLKRSLNSADRESDAVFDIGKKKLCAFGIWNGANGDRGGRKSISDWVELIIK